MVGKIVFFLMGVNFIGKTFAISDFALCDRSIYLYAGQSRSLYPPFYPAGYIPGSSCRYEIEAPTDYQIQVTCNIDMVDPSFGSCSSEEFYIAVNGNTNISNAERFCGTTTISRTSTGNVLTLAYKSKYYSGMFDCTLTTVCDCGWGVNSRIVGGQETTPNEFPSSAALVSLSGRTLYCGATIVSSRFVVTAAHCLRKTSSYDTRVLVGDHDTTRNDDSTYAELYPVLWFIEHPQYSSETDINDIGLVQTLYAMTWSRAVGPVCLPFYYSNYDFSGYDVTATGWGSTEFGGPKSNYSHKVDLTVLKNTDEKCQRAYPNIQGSQMCTYKDGKDTCQFDSGGPLYYDGATGSRSFLVGQVSLGEGCGGLTPSLNTRITSFMNWIEGNTGTLCRRIIY